MGLELGTKLWAIVRKCLKRRDPDPIAYQPLSSRDGSISVDLSTRPDSTSHSRQSSSISSASLPSSSRSNPRKPRYTHRLPFSRIFTRNVTFTLIAHALLAFHVGTFNALWFVFLSTPVYDPSPPPESPTAFPRRPPLFFTGGLGLQPREVGLAMAVLGVLGISLQLLVYPTLSSRLGTVRSWRIFLLFFPIAYFFLPYLSLVPSASPSPHPKDGGRVWVSIAGVLLLQVIGRTFALPAQTILVNNCTPHPSVLGTVHGIGQSVSSFARTVGPVLCGWLYGLGLANGVIGAVWWGLSCVALCGVMASWWVKEGDGHEIWLEGDVDDVD